MGTEIHSNKLRSHCQFPIADEKADGRKLAGEFIGDDVVKETEQNLKSIILERIPKGDETKREFDVRWVISCYAVLSEVKEKVEKKVPKKVQKKNGKDKKGNAVELPKSMEVKKDRVTSQNLIKNDLN